MDDPNDDLLIIEPSHQAILIEEYINKEIRFVDLQASLGLSKSNLRRRIKLFREIGADGLEQKKRTGSGRSHPSKFKAKVLSIIKDQYHDFGPKFAAEKLLERQGIEINPSTLRRWMIEGGIWQTRFERQPKIHSPRKPREQRGELIQIDGSYHRWFEKRGPAGCLICFIDDATSEIMHLRMVDNESSFNYMRCLKWYIEQHGRPLALYADKFGVFRSPHEDSQGNRNPTQFARACRNLGIKVICAASAQAKGRVERSFRTLQDRLIKEMRLANISTIEEANWFLESYRQKHNAQFANVPRDPVDAHRRCGNFNLEQLLTYNVARKVFKDLTVSFNKMRFILDNIPEARRAIGKQVTVVVYLDGKIEIYDDETSLPYRIFDKLRRVNEVEIVDNKRLGAALQMAKAIADVEPHQFKRNNHIMAGFRDYFPQPTDPVSVGLQNASKTIRRQYGGRSRGTLSKHPIIIMRDALDRTK